MSIAPASATWMRSGLVHQLRHQGCQQRRATRSQVEVVARNRDMANQKYVVWRTVSTRKTRMTRPPTMATLHSSNSSINSIVNPLYPLPQHSFDNCSLKLWSTKIHVRNSEILQSISRVVVLLFKQLRDHRIVLNQ